MSGLGAAGLTRGCWLFGTFGFGGELGLGRGVVFLGIGRGGRPIGRLARGNLGVLGKKGLGCLEGKERGSEGRLEGTARGNGAGLLGKANRRSTNAKTQARENANFTLIIQFFGLSQNV